MLLSIRAQNVHQHHHHHHYRIDNEKRLGKRKERIFSNNKNVMCVSVVGAENRPIIIQLSLVAMLRVCVQFLSPKLNGNLLSTNSLSQYRVNDCSIYVEPLFCLVSSYLSTTIAVGLIAIFFSIPPFPTYSFPIHLSWLDTRL